MMQKITIKDVRHAILYVCKGNEPIKNIQDFSDEDLLNLDLYSDLQMGNIRMANIVVELQRIYGLTFPWEIFRAMADSRVRTFMNTINHFLSDKKIG